MTPTIRRVRGAFRAAVRGTLYLENPKDLVQKRKKNLKKIIAKENLKELVAKENLK